jgi:integrase
VPRGTVVPLLPRVPSGPDARPRGESLPELFRLFELHRFPELRDTTRATYRQTFQLARALGAFPSVGEVRVWVTWLQGQYPPPDGCADSWTVHLHWHNLAALYSWAKDLGWSEGANPAAALKLRKPSPRARAIADVGEVWPLVLGACHDERERLLLRVALDCGGRRAELLGLMPSDLVRSCDPWRLRFERQRKPSRWDATPLLKVEGGARSIPLATDLARDLAQLVAAGAPRVWTGRGGQVLREVPYLFPYRTHELVNLRKRLGAVAPAAFPPGDYLHALRHTFAVELNRSGATMEEAQHALGHLSPDTTRRVYVNAFARPVDAAPFARRDAARLAGVTRWGAPPGGQDPPPARGGERGTATAPTVAVPRRSRQGTQVAKPEDTTCRTPSREAQDRRSSSSPTTPATPARSTSATTPPPSRRSSAGKPPARTSPPPASPSRRQRALPGLALGAVTTRRPR